MTKEKQILTLLQHGDSFFPSGAVSFSWGLEMLKDDNIITSTKDVKDFVKNQLIERWSPFERVVLAHTYDNVNDIEKIIYIDHLVECMTLASELRNGSKRLGAALLTTYNKLNIPEAQYYQSLIKSNKAYGHLPISQGLIWNSIGLPKNFVLLLSAYNFCVSVFGAALRLGLIGHIECQKSLSRICNLITEASAWPIPEIEEINAFTPLADIASMRHENADARLFVN